MINSADFIRWVRTKGLKHLTGTQNGKPFLVKVMPGNEMPLVQSVADVDLAGEMRQDFFELVCGVFGLNPHEFKPWCEANPLDV